GNLNEDGYLTASEEDLLQGVISENPALFEQANHDLPASDFSRIENPSPNGTGHVSVSPNGQALHTFRFALTIVQNLDPIGIATRDLRECLLVQITARKRELDLHYERRRQ